MLREDFTEGWSCAPKIPAFAAMMGAPQPSPVHVPHDAIRDLPRDAGSPQGEHTGYYPGGIFEYSKDFDVPSEWEGQTLLVEFEAVYRDAVVRVNGSFAAQRPNGYTGFVVDIAPYLNYGSMNTITVDARADRDSRWYSGAGLLRPVHLARASSVHIVLDGVRISTPQVSQQMAIAEITTLVTNRDRLSHTVRVRTELLDAAGATVAVDDSPLTLLPGTDGRDRKRLSLPDPTLWSVDSPALYTVLTTITGDGDIADEETSAFGVRRIELDPSNGLRINGVMTKLRGCCIHHDNGPLGGISAADAEDRRIRILRAAGFNAIRSAHNPIARATLDACDRHGMLVMDELTDVWTQSKTDYDYATSFPEWWERDLEAMITKDFNHPSVIMYSIGNEIFEVGSPLGSTWGRRIAEAARLLDPTRFITNAINPMIASSHLLADYIQNPGDGADPIDVNTIMGSMEEFTRQLAASDLVANAIEESAAVLDVVGLNYGDSRYPIDAQRHPHRILVGSETFGPAIDSLWADVSTYSTVIGDFTWTGWDYIGEAGIGRVQYLDDDPDASQAVNGKYPHLLAVCGDIDITGHRKPLSYYRETVFGLRADPYIAVHRPQRHGQEFGATQWAWTDSVSTWAWDVPAGSPVVIDVYTDADEVELLLDGRSLGVEKVGTLRAFQARFHVSYEPGTLVALASAPGREDTSAVLRSAGATRNLQLTQETSSTAVGEHDFVAVEFRDENSTVLVDVDQVVSIRVDGDGVLAGLGTGRGATEERFNSDRCTTFDGRALVIIRRTGAGPIHLEATTDGVAATTTDIERL